MAALWQAQEQACLGCAIGEAAPDRRVVPPVVLALDDPLQVTFAADHSQLRIEDGDDSAVIIAFFARCGPLDRMRSRERRFRLG